MTLKRFLEFHAIKNIDCFRITEMASMLHYTPVVFIVLSGMFGVYVSGVYVCGIETMQ